jgi:hypothetical protein
MNGITNEELMHKAASVADEERSVSTFNDNSKLLMICQSL